MAKREAPSPTMGPAATQTASRGGSERSYSDAEDLGWSCVIQFFDPDYHKPCPRCGQSCKWDCTITVWPRGPILQGTIHWPICPCPDDHIREGIVNALAHAVVNELVKEHPELALAFKD